MHCPAFRPPHHPEVFRAVCNTLPEGSSGRGPRPAPLAATVPAAKLRVLALRRMQCSYSHRSLRLPNGFEKQLIHACIKYYSDKPIFMSQAHCCCYIFGPSACLLFHSTTYTLNLINQPIKKEIRSISTRSNQLWLLKCSISFPSVTSALSRSSFLSVHSVGSLTPLPGTTQQLGGGHTESTPSAGLLCSALCHLSQLHPASRAAELLVSPRWCWWRGLS